VEEELEVWTAFSTKRPYEKSTAYWPAYIVFKALAGIKDEDEEEDTMLAEFMAKCCEEMEKEKLNPLYGVICYRKYQMFKEKGTCNASEITPPQEFLKQFKEVKEWAGKHGLLLTGVETDIDLVHLIFSHPCGTVVVSLWEEGWEISDTDGVRVEGDQIICEGLPKTTREAIENIRKRLQKKS